MTNQEPARFDGVLRDCEAPEHVVVHGSVERYKGAIFTILDDDIEFVSGDRARRQYMKHDDAVGIVALRPTEGGGEGWEVLLIKQYRHASRRLFWEVPAGLLDIPGENSQVAGARELLEETGYVAGEWRKLCRTMSSPGVTDEFIDIYLAQNLMLSDDSTFEPEGEERELEVVWAPLENVVEAIMSGDLANPTLISGVLAVQNLIYRGEL